MDSESHGKERLLCSYFRVSDPFIIRHAGSTVCPKKFGMTEGMLTEGKCCIVSGCVLLRHNARMNRCKKFRQNVEESYMENTKHCKRTRLHDAMGAATALCDASGHGASCIRKKRRIAKG